MEQGAVRGWRGLIVSGFATVVCLLLLTGPVTSEVLFSGGPGIRASATGTVVHAHVLRAGDMRLVDSEIAFTGSAFDSGGLKALYNEVGRRIASVNASKTASALEVGLGVTPPTSNQLILAGKAEASAPANTGPVTKEVGPVDLRPAAWANFLRGRAMADSSAACMLGSDIGNGVAYVGDVQLLDTGGTASASSARPASVVPVQVPQTPVSQTVDSVTKPVSGLLSGVVDTVTKTTGQPTPIKPAMRAAQTQTPKREGMTAPLLALDAIDGSRTVSQSRSRTLLVGQRASNGSLLGNNFGIMSEVRQTIAPVTLFAGTPNEITLEFLGEWVLQAVATGMPGGAYIHYGPGAVSPSTPVIRIIRAGQTQTLLKLQDLLGDKGFVLNIPGLAEIAIGEDPRAIGGSAESAPTVSSNGTMASAAVDVVRVRVLPGATELADVRVGHMETIAQVPAGGVSCPIPVTKGSSSTSVNVGDTYRQTFTVTNPYDCTLHNVTIHDAVSTERNARFAITHTVESASLASAGANLESGAVNWNNIGDIPPGGKRMTAATFIARGGAGTINDKAIATATLTGCARSGTDVAGVDVATVGTHMTGASHNVTVEVSAADVLAAVVTHQGTLPHTGAPILLYVAIAMALLAAGGAGLTLADRLRFR